MLCAGLLAGCGGDNDKKSNREDRTEERRTRAERLREYLNSLERRIADLEQENSLQQSKIEHARRELGIVRAEVAAAAARYAASQKAADGASEGAAAAEIRPGAERDTKGEEPKPVARRGLWVTVVLLAFITFVALYGLKLWREQQQQSGEGTAGEAPPVAPPAPEAPPPDLATPDTDNYVKIRPPAESPPAPPPVDTPTGPPDPWAAGDASAGDDDGDAPRPA
jgi:hypothetical protein